MNLLPLTYRSQMQVLSSLGRVVDNGNFSLVESPLDPDWFWGTFMVMENAPSVDCLRQWEKIWDAELPQANHRSFCWNRIDGDAGEIKQFTDAGYERFDSVTLSCKKNQRPPDVQNEMVCRLIESDEDWAELMRLQMRVDAEKYTGGKGRYKIRQMENYRTRVRNGEGQWWGACLNGTLVGDMGVFNGGAGIARLQLVETHPDFRRMGICKALTQAVVNHSLAENNFSEVVVVALANHPAVKLYLDAGFEMIERTVEISIVK